MAAHYAPAETLSGGPRTATPYGWIIFALSFGLLISDYMARQVLNAVFPLLKVEWQLSDGQLGLLSGIVALMVGLMTIPLSLVADRWGRVRSLAVMAMLWSIATIYCSYASGFEQMLFGRALVGLGEAAYGSVGIALVLSVFPQNMRATIASSFMAGGLGGQVIGVALGAHLAASHGWRFAFLAIGVGGLILGIIFPLIVREKRVQALAGLTGTAPPDTRQPLPVMRALFASRSVLLAYAGSGLALFAAASLAAWMPTFFTRYYHLPVDSAGRMTAVYLLISGLGMVLCGIVSDRVSRNRPDRKIALASGYVLITAIFLFIAMMLPPGIAQLIMLGVVMLFSAGTTGPAGAMVANLTPLAIHGSAFATLTLANNVFGLAPGPMITGHLADTLSLSGAFKLLPLPCLASALVFALMRRSYLQDLESTGAGPEVPR